MGSTSLAAMLESTDPGIALLWHLEANLWPPIRGPHAWQLAHAAINACIEEEPDRAMDGIVGRDGGPVPAWRIVEDWHLEQFIPDATGGALG